MHPFETTVQNTVQTTTSSTTEEADATPATGCILHTSYFSSLTYTHTLGTSAQFNFSPHPNSSHEPMWPECAVRGEQLTPLSSIKTDLSPSLVAPLSSVPLATLHPSFLSIPLIRVIRCRAESPVSLNRSPPRVPIASPFVSCIINESAASARATWREKRETRNESTKLCLTKPSSNHLALADTHRSRTSSSE